MEPEVNTWEQVALGAQQTWESRARLVAKLIRPTDAVLDLGAGNRKLARYIPAGCRYTPVDCVDALPGTFLTDLNADFRLPAEEFSVVVCAGLLEYIDDVGEFFAKLARLAPGKMVVATYMFSPTKAARREMVVRNDFARPDQLFDVIRPSVSWVSLFEFHNETLIFSALLSPDDAGDTLDSAMVSDIVGRKEGPLERLLMRTRNSMRKRMPRGAV